MNPCIYFFISHTPSFCLTLSRSLYLSLSVSLNSTNQGRWLPTWSQGLFEVSDCLVSLNLISQFSDNKSVCSGAAIYVYTCIYHFCCKFLLYKLKWINNKNWLTQIGLTLFILPIDDMQLPKSTHLSCVFQFKNLNFYCTTNWRQIYSITFI